jgi:outer membrane receptor protein involved in Fe transport
MACAGVFLILSAPAEAKTQSFRVAPGPLANALVQFGQQARMTVGLSDPTLANTRSGGVQGQLTPRQALRRLLVGTGARYDWIDARTVRISREPEARPNKQKSPVGRASTQTVPPGDPTEIIVTASKRRTPLRDYPGSVSILSFDKESLSARAAQGTTEIVAQMPILASTHLGPGRNKLFIRGVADSSFSGFSQTTVGEYLGDVRLTYYAPDPNLNLYDIERVEVLEGPQGTLYGTGGLGGIIRLVPALPNFARNEGSASAGAIGIDRGGNGFDVAGMANVVLANDRAALRFVAYSAVEPGYIDDPSRGLNNVNQTTSQGGRIALAIRPGGDWLLTAGAAMQDITSKDSQYVLRRSPPFQRSTQIAQPFDNDYSLAYATLENRLEWADFTSTTSIVRHNVDSMIDATVSNVPRKFEEDTSIRLFSNETRFSHRSDRDSWVAGLSGLRARARTLRKLGAVAEPEPIAEVKNTNLEAALFGQYSRSFGSGLSLTAGARISYARSSGEVGDESQETTAGPKRTQFRLSPMAAVSWQLTPKLLAYVHWQSAFRPGLLEVTPAGAGVDSQRVEADSISTIELGSRFGDAGRDRFSLSASMSYSRWSDIQADQIDQAGLPFTDNLGDGRIKAFEVQANWLPWKHLQLEGSAFLSSSRLAKPMPQFADADERELPNIPHFGGRVGATFSHNFDERTAVNINGALRYVGSSDLGIGFPLDVSQGKYLETSLRGRLARGAFGLSVDVENLFNERGNRFSFGNPFTIDRQDQVTPMVPRRVRVGLDYRF